MSYRLSHLGEAAVEAQATQPSSSMPVYAAQIMGLCLLPWVPPIAGIWTGKKLGGSDGAWLGGISGFVVSVAVITSLLKKVQS